MKHYLDDFGLSAEEARKRHVLKLAAARKERARIANAIERERVIEEAASAPRRIFQTPHGPAYRKNGITLPYVSALGR